MSEAMTDERIKDIWDRANAPGDLLNKHDARYLLEVCYLQGAELHRLRQENEFLKSHSGYRLWATEVEGLKAENVKLRKVVESARSHVCAVLPCRVCVALRKLDKGKS